jgi:lipoate---protein ligase
MMTSPLAAKTVPLHLLVLENAPIFYQLQIEEALLRADDRNWCLINMGSPPAIVMGISGKPELLINREALAKRSIPIIKRFSGVGTVVVDPHTLFISWICNAHHAKVSCCPEKIHQWTEKFYQNALPSIGLTLRENDYVIGHRKFGGNAQYLCKGRWLHHSSLLWDFSPENMQYLLMPAKTPEYRQQRSHEDFLCRLRDYIPEKSMLKAQMIAAVAHCFDVREAMTKEVESLMATPHRKATYCINP